jgi:hypothetical protein
MLATSINRADLGRLLSEYDANPNQVESTNGWTVLIRTAKQGH